MAEENNLNPGRGVALDGERGLTRARRALLLGLCSGIGRRSQTDSG